jgi:hypothetical protein
MAPPWELCSNARTITKPHLTRPSITNFNSKHSIYWLSHNQIWFQNPFYARIKAKKLGPLTILIQLNQHNLSGLLGQYIELLQLPKCTALVLILFDDLPTCGMPSASTTIFTKCDRTSQQIATDPPKNRGFGISNFVVATAKYRRLTGCCALDSEKGVSYIPSSCACRYRQRALLRGPVFLSKLSKHF